MHPIVRPGWGYAALTLLLCSLFSASTQAEPLPLTSLLFQPALFAAMFNTPLGQTLLPTSLRVDTLTQTGFAPPVSIPASDSAPPPSAPPLPLASSWLSLRLRDPSLRLADWGQVLDIARIGVFVIPLRDDPAERANILLAAQAVDDTTVLPGGVFSFNQTVGERTPEKGYQDGLMFSQGQIIRGTGGGICLVATGLYNAALQSGLALLERHPHSGIVGYAPPGCDASVVYGSEDMQFQNTTTAPVIVKTDIQEDRIIVSLYGKTPPPGRKVFVRDTHLVYLHAPVVERPDPTLPPAALPVVVQKPRLGFDVTVERVITQGGRVLRRETVVSEHRAPRPKIVSIPVPPVTPVSDELFSFQMPALLNPFGQEAPSSASAPSPLGRGAGRVDSEADR